MKLTRKREGREVLQGRFHLMISSLLFLVLGLISLITIIDLVRIQIEISDILRMLLQTVFVLVTSCIYYLSRNSKKYSKLAIAVSSFYILVVLLNYFDPSGIGTWRLISVLIPLNAIIGAYKNIKGIPLVKSS